MEWGDLELIVDLNLVITSWESVVDSSPKFTEIWKTSSSHPDNEVLIFHILPLNIFPGFSFWKLVDDVLELICDIRGPGNVGLVNCNLVVCRLALVNEFEGVVEHRLGDETARNSWFAIFEFDFRSGQVVLLIVPEVGNGNNWVAV